MSFFLVFYTVGSVSLPIIQNWRTSSQYFYFVLASFIWEYWQCPIFFVCSAKRGPYRSSSETRWKNVTGVLLWDLSAAFDCLDSEILYKKLKFYGFTDLTIEWFNSFLVGIKLMFVGAVSFGQVKKRFVIVKNFRSCSNPTFRHVDSIMWVSLLFYTNESTVTYSKHTLI